MQGNIELLEYLNKLGGRTDLVSIQGVNCLHLACYHNQIELVKYFIARGFSPEQETHSNRRPIHLAAQVGALGIVRFLVEQLKVNVTAVDTLQDDALSLAI